MNRPAETVLLALLAGLVVAGCAAGAEGAGREHDRDHEPDREQALEAPSWVSAPAGDWDEQAEPLAVQITGSAVIGDSLAAAESAAHADALALLSAFLDGAQVAIAAPGSQPAAVATAVQSARVHGKFHDGQRYFVWMSCDAGLVLPQDAPPKARQELARLVARRNRG